MSRTQSTRSTTLPAPDAAGDRFWNAPLAMAALAHEIRNPLLSVSANMELLLDQLESHDPRRRCVDRALAEVDRLAAVIDRLVDFAASHRPELRPAPLVPFLREALVREGESRPSLATDLSVASGLAEVVVLLDAELLGRVVANLVDNAAQAMDGAGCLRVGVERGAESGTVSVRFEDEGPGVPEALRDSIFEPFVTTRASGTGLGLPTSRRIARAHGGELTAVAGEGGRFELVLPLSGEGRSP